MIAGGSIYHIDYQNFILQVYVIGYRTKGESIVILFKENNQTFYSIVIDSYHISSEPDVLNKTIEILAANGVKCVSMLFMSHPHEDHILGMDKLVSDFCDGTTRFYYPTHSFDLSEGVVALSNEEKAILNIVRQKKDDQKTFSNPVGVPARAHILLENVNLCDNDGSKEIIEIVALTPIVSVNEAKRSNKYLDPNDLSISLLINMQEYYLFFGADTTNAHIQHLNNDTMSAVKFVKIPHHASDTADQLINFFGDNQLDYACCTSFYVGQSCLPNTEVLNAYTNVSKRVDIIGCSTTDKRSGSIGVICYQFRPGSREVISSVCVEGLTNQVK